MFGINSRCTEIASSQLLPRFRFGSITSDPAGNPKLLLVDAPISENWIEPSGFTTVPSLLLSRHVRVFDCAPSGFRLDVVPSALAARNFPTDSFNAVLPLPKRSYEPPARIDQSWKQGWQSAASTSRAGTN